MKLTKAFPLLLLTTLLLTSCSTYSSIIGRIDRYQRWSEWKLNSVPSKEKIWRFCREELDGPRYHEKGVCFQDQECRSRKRILGKKKVQCRKKTLFCEWGNVECLKRHNIFFNIIINEGVTR